MRDQVVLEIQECLRMLPRTDQAKPRIIPDGIYGEETRAAVEEFQRSTELPVTGKVDLATWNALQRASAESAEQQGPSNPIYPFEIRLASGELRKGDEMNLVYILQIMLNTLCGVYKNLRPLPVDGKYGSATEEDVMLFQSVQRLPETGYVDKITWNRLADAYNRYVDRD